MSFLKLNGSAGVALVMAFVAFAMIMASSQTARADTITLVCPYPSQPSAPPITFDLDQTHSTVTESVPGYPPVKYTATFDAREIKWILNNNMIDKIDRVTGTYTTSFGAGTAASIPCHVGQAQF